MGAGPGCLLYASGEVAVPVATDPLGNAAIPATVPNDLSLVGQVLYHNWLLIDPGAPNNPIGLTASNGAAATIGY